MDNMTITIESPVKRLHELDAVRGVASLIVVFEHFSDLFYRRNGVRLSDPVSILKATPLGVLVQGPAAVVTFFVLSGFVLSLPFQASARPLSWSGFVLKRICRLYLPFLFGFCLAVSADALVSTHGIPSLNAWFNKSWDHPVDIRDALSHAFLVNHYDYTEYNKAYWTLAYEMQLSIVFPVLFWASERLSNRMAAVSCFVLMLLGTSDWGSYPAHVVYLASVIGMFLLGILIARNRNRLQESYRNASPGSRRAMLVIALLAFAYAGAARFRIDSMAFPPAILAVGSAIIVITASADQMHLAILRSAPFQFLGKISYSLYLIHLTVLYTLIYVSFAWAHSWSSYWYCVLVAYLALSFVVALVFFKAVEEPCIRLSQRFKLSRP